MAIFDRFSAVNASVNFGFYGDTIKIEGGPYGTAEPVETVGVLTYLGIDDSDTQFATNAQPFIEYPKEAWPNPQRGDQITFTAKQEVYEVAKLRSENNTTIEVDVIKR